MEKIVEYEVDLKTGKATVTNHDVGHKHVIDPTNPVEVIQGQLEVLKLYRDDGRVPSAHLLKDIATYEYILNSSAPKQLAELYMKTKRDMIARGLSSHNYRVAEYLGWNI